MRRWLLRIFGLTMLLLCVAFVALGVRSTWRADIVYFQDPQHWGYLKSVAGSISYCRTWVPPHLAENLERRRGFGYANYYRVEAREGWWRREWFTWSRGAVRRPRRQVCAARSAALVLRVAHRNPGRADRAARVA